MFVWVERIRTYRAYETGGERVQWKVDVPAAWLYIWSLALKVQGYGPRLSSVYM